MREIQESAIRLHNLMEEQRAVINRILDLLAPPQTETSVDLTPEQVEELCEVGHIDVELPHSLRRRDLVWFRTADGANRSAMVVTVLREPGEFEDGEYTIDTMDGQFDPKKI